MPLLFRNVPLDAPSNKCAVITPSDSVDLAFLARAIYVGGAGNVAVVTEQNDVVTFVGVPAGTVLPVVAARVNATNTTATNLVALF